MTDIEHSVDAFPRSSHGLSPFPVSFAGYGVLKMKRLLLLTLAIVAVCPGLLRAEDFLGVPVIPGGKVQVQSDSRLEKLYEMPYADAVKFYEDAFKDTKLIKSWDRGDETYIEDHSNRPWHSVTITKSEKGGTEVVILKDNWTWIVGTLVIRFIGVFCVLGVLFIALSISGAIISRYSESKPKPAPAKK